MGSIKSRNIGELTPRARKLYGIARGFIKTARELNTECAGLKRRLKQAQHVSESTEFMKAKLNKVSYDFVMSQLRLQRVSPKGRRFSLEEKIFSLSLLKQSPKAYKMLAKIFAVPSRKTLTNLLRQVPFETGVNPSVVNLLKSTVQKMKPQDTYCTIIFDEISLDPSLLYNKKKDVVEGFQDNGSGERRPQLADKAMVYMARGIHKKWKQPLAYYFNEGGMKKDTIVKTLKDVIRAARSAGLKVVATICDQGAPNVAAIQALYKETEMEYTKRGEENRNFGFEIDGEEVVPLYDPPHLLKGIRNALYDYDVRYSWRNGKNKTATWKHIRKLYDFEDVDEDYKLCYKLTEAHINNTKKMKVNLAAQIFSASVAAAIKTITRTGKINFYL